MSEDAGFADAVAVGDYECECGTYRLAFVSGGLSMLSQCPNCGRIVEMLPGDTP